MTVHTFETTIEMRKPFRHNSLNWETYNRGFGQYGFTNDWGGGSTPDRRGELDGKTVLGLPQHAERKKVWGGCVMFRHMASTGH